MVRLNVTGFLSPGLPCRLPLPRLLALVPLLLPAVLLPALVLATPPAA
jgi:hypothetical protein